MTQTIHKQHDGGTQVLHIFDNGYGASVVCHHHSYGGRDGLYELAVIKNYDEVNGRFALGYDTPITSDVIGYLKEDEVAPLLAQIEALPSSTLLRPNMTYQKRMGDIMSNLSAPYKLKQAIQEFDAMDPVDAMKATHALADLMALRVEEMEKQFKQGETL